MPLSTTDWTWYTTTADTMSAKYPATNILPSDFMGWATESYDLAKEYVYSGFTTGQIPSTTYDNTAISVIETNMMLGGARLANLIETIYGSNALFLQ
jgi:hypothetical protein